MYPSLFIAALFTVTKTWKQPKSFDGWLDKEVVVQIFNGILLSHTKGWNTVIRDNMDGSWEYHAKQNKSDRKGQGTYDFTHMWDVKLSKRQHLTWVLQVKACSGHLWACHWMRRLWFTKVEWFVAVHTAILHQCLAIYLDINQPSNNLLITLRKTQVSRPPDTPLASII